MRPITNHSAACRVSARAVVADQISVETMFETFALRYVTHVSDTTCNSMCIDGHDHPIMGIIESDEYLLIVRTDMRSND